MATTEKQLRDRLAQWGNYWRKEDILQEIRIDEIPVMWSITGDLVCLKNTNDEHTIGAVGLSAAGKSFFVNSIAGRLYYYGKKKIFIGNDYQGETYSWVQPNGSQEQVQQLAMLGEKPMGLPIVHLAPNTKAFKEPPVDHLKIVLPFKEVLMNCEYYMKLGLSANYFKGLLPKLMGMTFGEVTSFIDGSNLQYLVKDKLQAALSSLWDDKLIEGVDIDSVSMVKIIHRIKEKAGDRDEISIYNVLLGLLYCNVIPAFLTGDLLTKPYYDIYMRYFFDSVMDAMKFDPYFSRKDVSVYAVIDELTAFASTEAGRRSRPATQAIRQYAARGRFNRLGMVYATQNYSKIEKVVRTNTRYLFVLRYNNSAEMNAIAGDFQLSDYQREAIGKLPKFHMLAMSQGEKFVTYGPDGTRQDNVSDVIEGISLPPLSQHSSPRDVIGRKAR